MPRNGQQRRGVRDAEAAEVQRLEAAIAANSPPPGASPLAAKEGAAAGGGSSLPMASARNFDQLPLSGATLEGLKSCKFKAMTAIQRAAIPHALAGRDVLGAAKTGSGKTLAFLVPVRWPGTAEGHQQRVAPLTPLRSLASTQLVEKLFRQRWSPEDGVGAIVITPTRELAMQIFDTLRCAAPGAWFLGIQFPQVTNVRTCVPYLPANLRGSTA
jgi:ATP-dependent RNA helicase DDX10/DBP4